MLIAFVVRAKGKLVNDLSWKVLFGFKFLVASKKYHTTQTKTFPPASSQATGNGKVDHLLSSWL